jgi:hypothetical protein
LENAYLDNIVGRKAAVRETPYTHKPPANIPGLKIMMKLGCRLTETGFDFSEPFESFYHLSWTVDAFRLATAIAAPATQQIHTHIAPWML